jgi:hypothetical protein
MRNNAAVSLERLKEVRDASGLTIASYRTRHTSMGWECDLTCGRPGNAPRWTGNGATKQDAIDHAAGHAVSYWESVGRALPG